MRRIRTSVISVSDKTGLQEFAGNLAEVGVSILATGGTYKTLAEAKIPAQRIEDYTSFPEMLDGRVKTLQPEIFAGILARRVEDHMKQLEDHRLRPIDMVVCNFYPFENVVSREDATYEDAVENIDIGGPSLVRAAAKNHEYVTVVPSPAFYTQVLEELKRHNASTSRETRVKLAQAAFGIVAAYDIAIYKGLRRYTAPQEMFPERLLISATKFEEAKYGENPDQRAAVYRMDGCEGMADWAQLWGESRSFNNHLDIGSAHAILEVFEDNPSAATVKHGHISGLAFAPTLAEAYSLAHSCDPEADYGCTTVMNRVVDVETARLVGRNEALSGKSVYTEIVMAPDYHPEALEILKAKQKRKIRIIKVGKPTNYPYDVRFLHGIVLAQERADYHTKLDRSKITCPTKAKPDSETLEKMLNAWEVVRKVESNGIAICDGKSEGGKVTRFWTLGVGSFRKRNGATKIALDNAGERARGAVAASDGFFPFRDSVDFFGKAGVRGIIQPGGSINDPKITEAADEYHIPMIMTHIRAFKH